MWIKFEVKGELLDQIKKESNDECRTPTQQALYIIKSYYKDKLVPNSSNKELAVTDNNSQDTTVTNKEQKETNDYSEISSDVIDF